MSLVPLPDGDLLVATADPWLGRLQPDGTAVWAHGPPKPISATNSTRCRCRTTARASASASLPSASQPARFDLTARALTHRPARRRRAWPPRARMACRSSDWLNDHSPDARRPAAGRWSQYEMSRSLAVHPAGDRFVLGAEWSLRAFDAKGTPLWTPRRPRRLSGRSTSPATAGWSWPPTATARSAGTG